MKTWEHSFDAMEKNGKLDDQAIFWSVLRHSNDPGVFFSRNCSDLSPNDFSINEKLTICPLNLCKFNSGNHCHQYSPLCLIGIKSISITMKGCFVVFLKAHMLILSSILSVAMKSCTHYMQIICLVTRIRRKLLRSMVFGLPLSLQRYSFLHKR